MRAIIERSAPVSRRLLWFAGLWVAGVACVGAVSLLLRAWIGH